MSATTETSTPQTSAGKSPMVWPLVAQRELMVKLRDKAFILSTLATILILIGVFAYQGWAAERTQTYDVAVSAADASTAQQVADAAPDLDDKVVISPVEVADAEAARAQLASGDVDAWLHQDDSGWVLTGQSSPPGSLEAVVAPAIQQIVLAENAASQGVDVQALQAGSVLTTDQIDGDSGQQQVGQVVGFAMAFLFYMATVLFGITLANSVVEEKQSRIVEIIAATIPVRQLLLGKILGNVALALLQVALYTVIALIGLSFTPWGGMLPAMSAGLIWFVVFFVVGFTAISTLYAVAGSLASRTEDVQTTSTPVTMLTLAMFFGAVLAGDRLQDTLQWIPPFSAIIMPMRLVTGDATWWQAGIALAILVVATGAVILVAERLYRRALLQTSGTLSYRQAWNAEV